MEDGYKRCPDCAEMVLAAARKCRYCGYRFDGASAPSGNALADLLRRPPSPTTMPELLSGWGTELEADERVDHVSTCQLDGRAGFLLVTSARVAFYAGRGHDRVIEWPRGEVHAFVPPRRLPGRRLCLSGPDGDVTLSRFTSRNTFAEIVAALPPQTP